MTEQIVVRGARLHNLKNIDLALPKGRLVVLTGLSGSGKSTLGFDILLKEGQRQYIEALGMVPLGLARPPVDAIVGLAPTVSVDQHLSHHSPRSTVGTATGVYTYLRLLYARLGRRPCPACGQAVPPHAALTDLDPADVGGMADDTAPEATFPCPHCGAPVPELGMAHFSFNKPEGACPTCTGLGTIHAADLARLVDAEKSVLDGAVHGWEQQLINYHATTLAAAAAHYGFALDLTRPVGAFTPIQQDLLYYGVESPQFRRHFPTVAPPATVRQGRFEGVATSLLRRYAERAEEVEARTRLEAFLVTRTCPDCKGARLRPESCAVTVEGQTIITCARLPLTELEAWLRALASRLDAGAMQFAGPILAELQAHIGWLVEVGAGYLALERSAPSLSAGEAQRLRLASLLGSELAGLLYVFDEPTIGLHQRDTHRLVGVLRRLVDRGNTVLVIEHDLETIAAADCVVDFGPGAGRHGGQVVVAGTPAEVAAHPGSITGAYLAGRVSLPLPAHRRLPGPQAITIAGARHHNLQNITVRVPLGLLVAVTGVSGSGKSSLVFDILDRFLRRHLYGAGDAPGDHDAITGHEVLDKVITIDQEHVGRVPRSNVATYADIYTPIRAAFAAAAAAQGPALGAGHFSFNVAGGRCERCEGTGVLAVKMHFLPDVEVRCPACHGRRFQEEVLAVHYRGHDIAQVLELTVDEALLLFQAVPAARARLQVLADVGLGYLQLGQPATTLSGGEAQRVKLARELGRRATGHTLYLLDEPTTGLHLDDVARLLRVLQRLVEAGNSVVVVEHNLELVKAADWVIDLGPEGGDAGGRVLAEGSPEQVARTAGSITGEWLQKVLRHLS